MEKDLIDLLQEIADVEELGKKEIEEIENSLSGEQQKELQEALQTFFDNTDEVPTRVNKAAAVLTKLIIALATETEEEKEEEEEEGKKVKKSPSWSFTLGAPRED